MFPGAPRSPHAARSAAPAPAVLAYHAIHEPEVGVDAKDVITAPEDLERDVSALREAGYRFLTAGGAGLGDGGGFTARRHRRCDLR